jgi:hypothetical protein
LNCACSAKKTTPKVRGSGSKRGRPSVSYAEEAADDDQVDDEEIMSVDEDDFGSAAPSASHTGKSQRVTGSRSKVGRRTSSGKASAPVPKAPSTVRKKLSYSESSELNSLESPNSDVEESEIGSPEVNILKFSHFPVSSVRFTESQTAREFSF